MGNTGQAPSVENTAFFKPGLSGSAVKYAGLVMMVFDHLHQMFFNRGAPRWFTWIGRPVLPIFLFMCAEAFWYTRSRRAYLLRLLVCFLLMSAGDIALSWFLPVDNIELSNNVFQTLFLAALYMLFIEMFRAGIREKRPAKAAGAAALMLLPAAVGLGLWWNAGVLSGLSPVLRLALFGFVPNFFTTEGGFSAVVLGALFYLFRKYPLVQALILAVFSVLAAVMGFITEGLFGGSAQWLMVFALVFILLYNGRRGRGNKRFFYFFYPAHIFLFYVIAWFIK